MPGIRDSLRARAFGLIDRVPGPLGGLARKANDVLGRPLADRAELEDRRAFASRNGVAVVSAKQPAASAPAGATPEAAPVIVYHMDKTRRDAQRLTELLDAAGIPHKVSNIQEDPAAQMAVRRDSGGFRLPVVFIAGEPVGGRTELTNLERSGELKKKVFG